MSSEHDLLSLIPPGEVPKKKVPSKRNHNHLGAPSGTGSGTGGKKTNGVDIVEGDLERDAADDESSSTDGSEDADDEDDDEPDDNSPVKMNRKRKYSTPASTFTLGESVHQTGRKRAYSMASTYTVDSIGSDEIDAILMAEFTDSEDETDYPRKKVARRKTPSDASDLFSLDDEADGETINDTELNLSDDDGNIEDIEAEAIAREFELENAHNESGPAADDTFANIASEDSDFDDYPTGDYPSQWTTLSGLFEGAAGFTFEDIFSEPVTRDHSNENTPKAARLETEALQSDGWSDDDDEEDEQEVIDPFMSKSDPKVKLAVKKNDEWGSTWIGDSEDDEVWKYFESGTESNDSANESAEHADEEADDEDDDATDCRLIFWRILQYATSNLWCL